MEALLDEKVRLKAIEGEQKRRDLKQRYGIQPIMKATRQNCLDCMWGSAPEVHHYQALQYQLFPYRFGRNPREEDLLVNVFDNKGNLVGQRYLFEATKKEAA